MERLLLGDNQFFGINHMSEERARAQQIRFSDDAAIMAVIDDAYAEGVTSFMCTTHDRLAAVCDTVRSAPDRYPKQTFQPCMPYAHKYANAVTEYGMINAVRRFLPDAGLLDTAVRGTASLARQDLEGIIRLLIDAEMTMFRGLRTPVIWLQNVVTDLLLGLGFTDAFRIFAEHVGDRYGAEPGFITMNLPRLVPVLHRAGIARPLVCANINKAGFRMSGGAQAYADTLRDGDLRAVAMSVFASGAIPAQEAIEWVCAQPGIESIVFGASSRANIAHTRSLVQQHWAGRF